MASDADGFDHAEKTITLAEGEHQKVRPQARQQAPPRRRRTTAAAVGRLAGVRRARRRCRRRRRRHRVRDHGLNDKSAASKDCVGTSCSAAAQKLINSSLTEGNVSTVVFIVGGVGLMTGAILLIVKRGSKKSAEKSDASIEPGSARVGRDSPAGLRRPELRFVAPDLASLDGIDSEVLACSVWSDERPSHGVAGLCDFRLAGRISALERRGFLTGEPSARYLDDPRQTKAHLRQGDLLPGAGSRAEFERRRRFAPSLLCMFVTLEGLGVRSSVVELPGRHEDLIAADRAADILLASAAREREHDVWTLVENPDAKQRIVEHVIEELPAGEARCCSDHRQTIYRRWGFAFIAVLSSGCMPDPRNRRALFKR